MIVLKTIVDTILVLVGLSFVATAYNKYSEKSCNLFEVLCGACLGATFFALAFVVLRF